ncbi:MFS transporter [Streptomyces sp. ACA25]|uniref:MFS transporter n=1 Tax=Streptomyces sp. ACA25 TaxID=3022596 RepID=UPI002307BB3A|nr:MFS transporter [Streptomyces sp. ACA25]MDB1086360.1 MFS transporter [Streptomyces sp. ACA25]
MTGHAPPGTDPGTVPRAGRREWVGLAVLALPTLLLALDMSVLHLAAPHLSADLRADSTQLLWILDIYGFMIAGFLVTMGTLGDRIGRRKLLMAGATAFGAASVLAAYSTSPEMLIATRALLGIAGATLMPSTLALISNMFAHPRQRATAIGVWVTCFMAGAAVGPVVGGVLLEWFWWGSVFLLGVPVMVVLLIAAPFLLPEYRDADAGRIDAISVVLSLGAMIPLIYGLKECAKQDLATGPLLALVLGAASGLLFLRRQRTLASPLIDLRLFANRAFGAALAIMLLTVLTSGGVLLFFVQYLQMVEGLSPLQAGLWMLPCTLTMIVGALVSPVAARRIPPGQVVSAGLVVAALGYLLLTRVGSGDSLGTAVVAVSVAFLGLAPMMVLGTDLVLGSAPPQKAGSASSLSETATELGMALGVAALGSLGAVVYRDRTDGALPEGLPAGAEAVAADSLPGALAVAGELPADLAAALLDPAREAFTDGVVAVGWASAGLVLLLAVLAATLLRHVRPSSDPAAAGEAAASGSDHPPGHDAQLVTGPH